jgi:predicted nucleic acid-binding protein
VSDYLNTNIVLYALDSDLNKRVIAASLLSQKPIISTQVINECSHVLRRKRQYAPEEVSRELSAIIKAVTLVDVGVTEIHQAWEIAARYGFSHYDSLIIAAALVSNCSTLYSEDLLMTDWSAAVSLFHWHDDLCIQ